MKPVVRGSSLGDPAMKTASEIPRLTASLGNFQPPLERPFLVSKELDVDLSEEKTGWPQATMSNNELHVAYLGTLQCQLLLYFTCVHSKPDEELEKKTMKMTFKMAKGNMAFGAYIFSIVQQHHIIIREVSLQWKTWQGCNVWCYARLS